MNALANSQRGELEKYLPILRSWIAGAIIALWVIWMLGDNSRCTAGVPKLQLQPPPSR